MSNVRWSDKKSDVPSILLLFFVRVAVDFFNAFLFNALLFLLWYISLWRIFLQL